MEEIQIKPEKMDWWRMIPEYYPYDIEWSPECGGIARARLPNMNWDYIQCTQACYSVDLGHKMIQIQENLIEAMEGIRDV